MKRWSIAVLLGASLMSLAQPAAANIIYNVNITDGTETISGTITTDGTLGSILSSLDYIAFHLTVTGSALAFGPIDLSLAGSNVACFAPCGVASSTALVPGAGLLTMRTPGVGEVFFKPTEIDLLSLGAVEINDAILLPNGYTIGTVSGSAPEPATLALLGIGLAGLGFSRRARKQ